MKKLVLLCSTACVLPGAALAQSTGSVDFEKDTIVVTGSRTQDVGGVQTPDASKAKAVLTQEIIARQNPGQTILDTVNLVPGVSFQNNDAYGSSGGTINIRGFDSSRISLTFDGIQLNDSGNYAIFSNQQLDPELIEQVNVNLGSTDVDSPTASAVGGTVNYRTIVPAKNFSGRVVLSVGDFDFRRLFGVIHTGEIGPWGTRAFVSASTAKNDNPFNNYGKIDKQQYNARIWQPLAADGDFLSIAGHYNENRNNFFGSLPLRRDVTQSAANAAPRVVGPNSINRYPITPDERQYDINFPCQTDTAQPGVADTPAPAPPNQASCGTEFDRRYNPSNTGNIRGASRFTLADGVVLTVDPSFQYVKANGGGTVTGNEGLRDINPAGGTASTIVCATTPSSATNACVPGFLGGNPFFGRDVNGDGDKLDTVTVLAPSQTVTHRYGLIAGLRWDIDADNIVRFSYTRDHAKHRQTGEVGLLEADGEPFDVFPVNDPEADGLGIALQKRDRKSFAILNQVSAEYRGQFVDDRLNLTVGLRAPFFVRKLHNFCFTSSASGFVECFGQDAQREAQFAQFNPAIQGPQKRKFHYSRLLPNIGAVYDFAPSFSGFLNYSKNLSVPSTDNLYNSFFFAPDTPQAKPKPETTDSFDGGLRFRSGRIQAQLSGWYTAFKNRTASAFDPELNQSVFRNLGNVTKWGFDGSIAYEPASFLTLYAFGSWNKSRIKDNIQIAALPGGLTCDTIDVSIAANALQALRGCAFTAGKREAGAPRYTIGLSASGKAGPVEIGFTAKRTGSRFLFDNNQAVFRGDVDLSGVGGSEQIFGNVAPAYLLVDLDARVNLASLGGEKTYLQLNVYNLFDKFYVGGFNSGLAQSINASTGVWGNPPNAQIGAPRTISASLNFAW